MNKAKNFEKIGFALLIVLLIAIVLYSGFRVLEATVFLDDDEPVMPSKTIEKDGVEYFPRQDIETFLLIGVDETGKMQKRESFENDAMADSIMVVVFDKTEKKVNVLSLNRDTITDVPVIGLNGKKAGITEGQLALAYAYGDGMEGSCENTIDAVSSLLYGVEMDNYIALNMDAIRILNDAVGGVTVNVTDDFSEVDSSIKKGKMTLKGKQALTFIRARKDVGTQLNISRMERQKEYMNNFYAALKAKASTDADFALSTFDKVADYMVTDNTAKGLSYMLDRYEDYEMGEILIPEGRNVEGKYMEFYLYEDTFEDMVLKHFFAIKQ